MSNDLTELIAKFQEVLSAQFVAHEEQLATLYARPMKLETPQLQFTAFTLFVTATQAPIPVLSLDNGRHRAMIKADNDGVYIGRRTELVNPNGPNGYRLSQQGYDEIQTREEVFVYFQNADPTKVAQISVYVERYTKG